MPGPLHGTKVLDFSEVIAAPLAGRLLADLGADVIKVEPPWGEPWRLTQRFSPTESRQFMTFNRGKRSLPLDLTKPEAQAILARLIPQMDVILVNFRPDVAVKLGVDYEAVSKLNDRLIYAELTAYGREGPDAHRPGYDMILQAVTGLMASENKIFDGIPQQIWSTPLIDMTAGNTLSACVCAALFAREKSGKGQKVETSLLASAMTLLGPRLLNVESLDRENREDSLSQVAKRRAAGAPYEEILEASRGSRRYQHHGNIYYRVYLTKDGPICVGCLSDPLRRRLLETLELSDESLQPGWDPDTTESQAYGRALEKQAEELFIQRTTAQWLEIFEERGIPAGPVRFVEELFYDPQVRANGLIAEVEHRDAGKVKMVGHVAQFHGTPLSPVVASPALGEHTNEILVSLGFEAGEIEKWRESGVVG